MVLVAESKRWGVKLEDRLGIGLETKTESETVNITPRFLSWVVVVSFIEIKNDGGEHLLGRRD